MMGAGDIRVSVEQTEARIIGHESHGHGFPAGNSQRAWNRIERCTGIEPGSPPTGGGVLPLHQRPARVMNSVRSPSRDSSGWRPAMDSVARITRSVFA